MSEDRALEHIEDVAFGEGRKHGESQITNAIDEDALYAVLYEYRKCSEDQARAIIGHYLNALKP